MIMMTENIKRTDPIVSGIRTDFSWSGVCTWVAICVTEDYQDDLFVLSYNCTDVDGNVEFGNVLF